MAAKNCPFLPPPQQAPAIDGLYFTTVWRDWFATLPDKLCALYSQVQTLQEAQVADMITNTGILPWTPALTFGGASTGITYTSRSGSYYQLGNILHFAFYVELSSKGSATGISAIGGLPFVCNPAWPTGGQTVGSIFADVLTYTGDSVYWYATPGASGLSIYQQITAPASPTQLDDTAFANTTILSGSGFFVI